MKTAKTKANYSAKDLSHMKKTFTIFTILFPAVLTLSLLENFFTSNRSWKVQVVEFCVEWWQTAKILFGGKGYDYSIEIADYSFKVDCKRNKFDYEVAQAVVGWYGRYNLYFGKVLNPSLNYRDDDTTLKVSQVGADSFKLYYDQFRWSKSIKFNSSYLMTKEQVITMIKHLEKK